MAGAERDTVAIVNDDEAVRHSLRFLLESVEYEVQTFATAVEFLQAERQHIACLLLDHLLPDMCQSALKIDPPMVEACTGSP